MTVTSGKCEPPAYGSFVAITSPGCKSGFAAIV